MVRYVDEKSVAWVLGDSVCDSGKGECIVLSVGTTSFGDRVSCVEKCFLVLF